MSKTLASEETSRTASLLLLGILLRSLKPQSKKKEDAEEILSKIDELDKSLKLLVEQSNLEYLYVAKGAPYYSRDHEHETFCLKGTRIELLSHITYWANRDDKFMFWLNGMAGTGKSTIARTVVQGFKERGLLSASFFFKRGEADRVPEALTAIKNDRNITSKSLRNQFDQLLYQPLQKLQPGQSTTIVIIIDALNEYDGDDDIKLILHLLFKLQEIQSVRLRVVLTSKPELPIRLGFQEEKTIRPWFSMSFLPTGADGSPFVHLAATLCRFVGDEDWLPDERLTAVLQDKASTATSTSNLDKTYVPVLNQLFIAKNKKEFEQLLEEFQNIIGVIVLLATPLSVTTLKQLTRIPEKKITDRLKKFHSVLHVPADLEAPVRILHLSFRDFLTHTEGDFRIDEENTHRQITSDCLRVMNTQLRNNICDLASYGIQYKDIDPQIIQQRLRTYLQHSCYYWVHAAADSRGPFRSSHISSLLSRWTHASIGLGRQDHQALGYGDGYTAANAKGPFMCGYISGLFPRWAHAGIGLGRQDHQALEYGDKHAAADDRGQSKRHELIGLVSLS
ncbi:hypothetical protein N7495_003364 [Penicillium taxi]|uniref:uncharacterized protein n=1 Tax=Penicillium taxi TaxID=168475 RepID=UPI0025459852|nr:uncharacterized protein N7495_003364 [Penicillium taxi]KAJ5902836.1 hypothetical protein N7495_003364 [Penicillium taxi]